MKATELTPLEYIYRDTQIHFLLSNNENVMINATEMAKAFGKRLDVFLKSDHAKAFIKALQFTPYGVNSTTLNMDEIIQKKGHLGTYFHKILALKFASWLDAEFEVWIYYKIDEILFGKYNEHRKKVISIEQTKRELNQLEQEIIASQNETAIRLLEKQRELKTLEADKTKALKEQTNQIKFSFE